MKILFISVTSPPELGPESLQVGKYIRELSKNNQITLLTSKPSEYGWMKNNSSLNIYLKRIEKIITINDFQHSRISSKAITLLFPKKFQFPDRHFIFSFLSSMARYKIRKSFDLIYSRSMPFSSALMALKLKETLDIPWIMHLSDPWFGNPMITDNHYRHQELEYLCVEKADRISLTTENLISLFTDRYPRFRDKFLHFPNVYEERDLSSTPIDVKNCGKLNISYTGNLYGRRTLRALYNALLLIDSASASCIKLNVVGNLDLNNQQLVERIGNLINVKYYGRLSQRACRYKQKKSHVLLTIDIWSDDLYSNTCLPSKVQDYLSAQRRILAITTPGSPTDSVITSEYGDCVEFSDSVRLKDHLVEYVERFQNQDWEYFSYEYLDTKFMSKNVINRLNKEFISLVNMT